MNEHENEGEEQDRRRFLKTLGLGGAAAGLGLLAGTSPAGAATTIGPNKVSTTDLEDVASIEGVADHIVTQDNELSSVLSNLSDGDVVVVGDVTHDSWLDIDGVSDVTIIGIGNGTITTADSAEVGGFRIGWNSHVENLTIKNLTIDGNDANQTGNITQGSAIHVKDGDEIHIENCDIVNTLVTRGTGTGENSAGVRALNQAGRIVVRNCNFDSNVVRHVETSCTELVIDGMTSTNVNERCISLEALVKDNHITQRAYITNLDLEKGPNGTDTGAFIGTHGLDCNSVGTTSVTPTGSGHEELVFTGPIHLSGGKRCGFAFRDFSDSDSGPTLKGNIVIDGPTEQGILFTRDSTDDNNKVLSYGIVIDGVEVKNTGLQGVRVRNTTGSQITNVTATGCTSGISLNRAEHTVVKPQLLENLSGNAVIADGNCPDTAVQDGMIREVDKHAVVLASAPDSQVIGIHAENPALDTGNTYDGILIQSDACVAQNNRIIDENNHIRHGVQFENLSSGVATDNTVRGQNNSVVNTFNSSGVTTSPNYDL